MSRKVKTLENEIKSLKEQLNTKKNQNGFWSSQNVQSILDKIKHQNNQTNRFNNFKMPDPPKIVQDSEKITTDSMPLNSYDFSQFNKLNSTVVNSWFYGYQELALLSQNGLIQNIVQTLSQECTREWIEFQSVSKDKTEKINRIEKAFSDFKIQSHFNRCLEMTFLFGGCKLYPKIKGDDSVEDGATYEERFYLESMGKGDLLYFKPIEPLYATPIEFNATNPLSEDFYEPKMWAVQTTRVHTSRLMHFAYNYVPTYFKPVYWFYGMPLAQLCLDYIFGFETVRQNVVGISGRYNLNVFKTNMESLLDTGGSAFQSGCDLETRLKIAQYYQSNFSIFAMSNDPTLPEEWQQFNMSIAGLDGLLSQNAELVCAVARTPAIKLFGTSPKGFSSTGEYEVKIFHELVKSLQMSLMQDNLKRTLDLIQIHLFGEIDEDITFVFKPLAITSELERAQIQAIKKDINISYLNDGVISGEEVRNKLKDDPDSGYNNLTDDFELENELADSDEKVKEKE